MTETSDWKTVKFYGASDDLVEVEGDLPGCDEYPSEREIFTVGGLRVAVELGTRGVWGIAVEQVDESVTVTARKLRLSVPARSDGDPGYSICLEMDLPAGTSIVRTAPDAA